MNHIGTLFQLTNPKGTICAGLVVRDGYVTFTAPILYWLRGLSMARVMNFCYMKKWNIVEVE